MKIDQRIHQINFRDEFHKLLINILFTGNWVMSHQSNVLKEFDLTPQQYNLLRILRGKHPEPISVGDAQERMIYPTSNVTRITNRLLEKGFVKRTDNIQNRRIQDLSIEPKGLALLNQIDQHYNRLISVLDNLNPEEAQALNHLLDKIRESKE